ncbi:dTDP-4-dehydrorhamnose 3,5-epimerase [Jatrophihabitans sp.]|uniref:dTDP-4-dehydrorhamnose 3,5-epimerase family protein n=1 Tax=Jatrophihabitans sp. TaxID=1932789 RepID=UPI0030C75A80|nr:dTDP-4-dehydrorhamnose 35-epimerase related [Jatrophihabitans sp.]
MIESTTIDGLLLVTPKSVTDDRGTVRELFRHSAFAEAGLPTRWNQLNLTWTRQGAIRGLHGEAASKLIGLAGGTAYGVYLDARPGSPTRGAVATVELSVGRQVFVPAGVCNGFQATSPEGCEYLYCFDTEWTPGMPGVAVTPLDPALGISWPIPVDPDNRALLSAKDAAAPTFAEL